MKWVYSSRNDAINLDNIAHIWVEKCPNGYFLMGEMIHNQEEVVLSGTFSQEKCIRLLHDLFDYDQPERSKREDIKSFGMKAEIKEDGLCYFEDGRVIDPSQTIDDAVL